MKKKIAVLANGWNDYSVTQAIKGIKSCVKDLDVDVFVFLSYASYGQSFERNYGEDSIFALPDYSTFDGVIIFSAMLNSQETPFRIGKQLVEKNIKAVAVGMELPGIDYVGIENSQGMYDMVSHLVTEHHIKNPVFLAGPKENVDSNERLEAAKKALNNHGIKLKKSNIKYTNWEYLTSIKFAQEFMTSDDKPDAFICANDYIALGACIGIERSGFKVPDDAIVTGFDRISHAETFYPSITTVFQDYEKLGYIAIWHLLELIDGTAQIHKVEVSSKYLRNESCGCKSSSSADEMRRIFCRNAYSKEMENIIFQDHTTTIAKILFESKNVKSFKERINEYLQDNHTYEGDDFNIVITDSAIKTLIDSSFSMKKVYSKKMHPLVTLEKGKVIKEKDFEQPILIPNYKETSENKIYTITSLHFDDNLFGYCVMGDASDHIKDTTLNHYLMQLNSNLEKYRQNIQLDEMNKTLRNISIKDPLTGLYNRFGMEQDGVEMLENAHKEGKSCLIMFADINRMKHINDGYGHLQGDLAIRTVASSLLENIPESWIGIRYGGDEFLTLGVCDNEKKAHDLLEKINDYLEKQVASMQLSYPLTISCGYIFTDPKKKLSLMDYVNQADSVMYKYKKKTYEK